MALKTYTFVGLAKPVYLPDDILVEIKIIPAGNTNVRSNTKRAASDVKFVTRHETANFNAGADADMHYRYLMSNPDPAAGYNTVSDDNKVIQLTPYDEDTWAAGTYTGNHTSDHHELCVDAGTDHAKARRIAAAVDAGVLQSRGLTPQAGLLQHNYWTGKNCPLLMRANNNEIWNYSYYPMVKKFHADIVAHVSGGIAPTPTKQRTFTTRFELLLRTSPGFWDYANNKSNVVRTLPSGTKGTIVSGPKEVEGIAWYDISIPGIGTGWVQDEVLHTLTIA